MINKKGFTLLELLIALVIMSTLTIFSTQAIQTALKTKKKVQLQVDEMSQVRDALKIVERDINLAYHYRDLEEEFREAVKKGGSAKSNANTPPGSSTPPAEPTASATDPKDAERKANRADPTTQFEGSAEDMSFATMNTGRISESEAFADFAKVGYSVKSCKRVGGKQESTKCLMRRMSPYVEGDITKGGQETILLENVSEFKLKYFGKGKQDWVDSWSTKNGDAVVKGNFPGAVEISLIVENGGEGGAKKRKISMQIVAPVRFPNNKDKTETTSGSPAAGTPGNGTGAAGGSP